MAEEMQDTLVIGGEGAAAGGAAGGYWGAGIGALGAIAGSLLSGGASKSSAKSQMKFQKKMAQKGHQWEVDDLRKAGLNPILSSKYGDTGISQGAGWSLPDPDIAGALSSGARSYSESKRADPGVEVLRKTADKLYADTKLSLTSSALNAAELEKKQHDIESAAWSARSARELNRRYAMENEVLSQEIHREMAAIKTETKLERDYPILRVLNKVLPIFDSGARGMSRFVKPDVNIIK